MKKVTISKLTLQNFKGIKNLEISLNIVTKVFGDNATGKTTLVDAFTWLLFGKDSTDRKDFSIKTFDSQNNVIHKLDHEVAGTFCVEGDEMTLRRVLREKWVTKRGSENAELTGHETLFFWNDVPLQAGEYQAKVDQVISEQTFKMITSPLYFNTLKWQDRRNILTSIAGDISDIEIAATRLDFTALLKSIGNKSLEEFKKELAAKRKKLKDELAIIPARIDEVSRNTPEVKNWKRIEDEIQIVTKQIENIDAQIADSSKVHEAFYAKKQERLRKINDLKTTISNTEYEGRKKFQEQMNEKQAGIDAANRKIELAKNRKNSDKVEIDNYNQKIEKLKAEQAALRETWTSVNAETFTGFDAETDNFVCPTCKQMLPSEDIEAKKANLVANFNANKEKRLAQIQADGKAINPKIEAYLKEIATLNGKNYDLEISEAEKQLNTWHEVELKTVQALLSENDKHKEAIKLLEELESIQDENAPAVDNSGLKEKKSVLNTQLDSLKHELSTKAQIEQSETRKAELLRQEKEFASQLAEAEKSEFLIQEFTRAKVDALEGRINGMFSGVKFRLFDTQLNGGLIECCDTLIDGVPWNDANNAAKINAGIAIINVLSNHYGISAPIWIDNSESITNIHSTESQRIELYVSEADKVLRVA